MKLIGMQITAGRRTVPDGFVKSLRAGRPRGPRNPQTCRITKNQALQLAS